jgi:glycosyltransferase involved in cell wall biosynthesis
VRVYVELPEELDVPVWSERNRVGEVPDQTPYGLHKIARNGAVLAYRRPLPGRPLSVLAGKVRGRMGEIEAVHGVLSAVGTERHTADVILCMDERNGIAAALAPSGPPVVSGIAWLEHPSKVGRAHAALATRAMRRMAAVFTQSPGLTPVLAENWGLQPDRVHQVTLGIDADFYTPSPWPEQSGLVVSVGDDRMRDHDVLIEAVRHLRAGGVPAQLELATTLPAELPPELGVLHRRRMGARMRDLYSRCSVVAVALRPNVVGSGLTVVLEAMASARPIVVTANPGIEAYVEHGVTGLLVPPGDPVALARAVGVLLADPDRAMAMGRAGRAEVEARFTTQHMADDLYRVLKAATGGLGAGPRLPAER